MKFLLTSLNSPSLQKDPSTLLFFHRADVYTILAPLLSLPLSLTLPKSPYLSTAFVCTNVILLVWHVEFKYL